MVGQHSLRKFGASFFCALMGASMVFMTHAALPAGAASCDPVPFLAQGASQAVGGVTVTATVNTASQGNNGNTYLHRSGTELDTTWTFSPAISEMQFETQAHNDGSEAENYSFTARDANGATVATFDITNEDGQFRFAFASPVTSIAVTYTPTAPPIAFGSFLRLGLPSQAGACGVADLLDPPPAPPGGYWPEDYLERREAMLAEESSLPNTR